MHESSLGAHWHRLNILETCFEALFIVDPTFFHSLIYPGSTRKYHHKFGAKRSVWTMADCEWRAAAAGLHWGRNNKSSSLAAHPKKRTHHLANQTFKISLLYSPFMVRSRIILSHSHDTKCN